MIIKSAQAKMLLALLKEKTEGEPLTVLEQNNTETVRTLERAGLVSLDSNLRVILTFSGAELANTLSNLIDSGRLLSPEQWNPDWRWLGSEVIAMLDSSIKGGRITDTSIEPLKERGFVDEHNQKTYPETNEAGREVFSLYNSISPLLVVSHELAEHIRTLPTGPALSSKLKNNCYFEHLLESMRLIAYSIPDSNVYSFTALGQAVKNTLELGGFVKEGYVLTPTILANLTDVADGNDVPDSTILWLQLLGYIGNHRELLPAGEWALEVHRLWKRKNRTDVWSFSIGEKEIEVLFHIDNLRKTEKNSEVVYLEEIMNSKKLQIKINKDSELRNILYSLEAFNLVEINTNEDSSDTLKLTYFGKKVLEDQKIKKRSISSTSIKAITMTRKVFSAPNTEWFNRAQVEGIIGSNEPTKSGYFYAFLSENIDRKPYITKRDGEVFKRIREKGTTIWDILKDAKNENEKSKLESILDRLEAEHLIEILPDGNIVKTEAGRIIHKVLTSIPAGFATPITPTMYRVIASLARAGLLYESEKKIRIPPKKAKEAVKSSGLSPDTFSKAFFACKQAGYVGVNTVNELGLLVIEATTMMNPKESLTGYSDIYEYKKSSLKE